MNDKNVKDNYKVPISVIIPVYNVYEWLDECMQSVVNQTFENFEVVLINDGSTDGSDKKCLEWKEKDKRIRYISKKNEGLALTRNLGIKEAKGEYIVFIDSDDWIEGTFLEKMYETITESGADIVECDFWRYNNNTCEKTYRCCYGTVGVEYSLKEHMIYGQSMAWKYMSKKNLWIENGIEMPDCLSASHGIYALLLALSNKIVNIHEPLYYYRRFRKGSIMDTYGKKKNQKSTLGLSALKHLVKGFYEHNLYEEYKETIDKIVVYSLSDYLASQYGRLNKEEFDDLTNIYYEYVGQEFPHIHNDRYVLLGSYNFNRMLVHIDKIQNPYCRFNFSSIISIMSKPNSEILIKHRNRYREIMVQRDIYAYFWDIIQEIKPKYLFIDLLEERFDIVEYKGTFITKSDAFEGVEEMIDAYRIIKRDSKECEELWEQKCIEFINKVQDYIPHQNIVLVKNYLSECAGDCNKTEEFSDIDEIRKVNTMLNNYYSFFVDNCDGVNTVEASKCPMYFTDINYEYGAIPSHLNDVVNRKIAEMIEDCIKN